MGRCVETGNAVIKATIHYAGDSTVQFNCVDSFPQTGLGQVLPRFLKEIYLVKNHGKNGRSTKSFIDEGRLDVISEQIKEGDYLFIQFGHNDEKIQDPARYTQADGSYKDNLKKFINLARERGAYPLLITPIERCHFEDGHLYKGDHGPYVEAMKEVAREEKVPCIDLNEKTRLIMEEAGEEISRTYYVADGTHMSLEGAFKYGFALAEGIRDIGGVYKEVLIEELI